MLLRAEVVTDKDGSVWVQWAESAPVFWTLKLTDEHGNMLEVDKELMEDA